jgi:hypothetical protein
MDWSESVYDRSFSDRMLAGQDAAALDWRAAQSRQRYRIVRTRPKLTEWLSTRQVAELWQCSEANVKAVLARGGVRGAKRLRKGKGKPWAIPASLQPDGSYAVKRTAGKRGPASKAVSRSEPVPF